MKKLHGLKEAVGEYQANCKTWLCVIYLDVETGEIWARTYDDKTVHAWRSGESVHALNTYIQQATGDIKVTMQSIRKTADFVAAEYARKDTEFVIKP